MKKEGVVLRFGNKGFGFIQCAETRKEFFVHIDNIFGRVALMTGQRVEFEEAPSLIPGKAPQAVKVRLLPSETTEGVQ